MDIRYEYGRILLFVVPIVQATVTIDNHNTDLARLSSESRVLPLIWQVYPKSQFMRVWVVTDRLHHIKNGLTMRLSRFFISIFKGEKQG